MLGWSEHSDLPRKQNILSLQQIKMILFRFYVHREWIKAVSTQRVPESFPSLSNRIYALRSVYDAEREASEQQHLASGCRDENNCLNNFLTMNCTFPRVLVQSRLSDAVPQMSQLGLCCEPIAAPTLSLSRSRRLCACLTCGDPFSASSGGT